MAELLSQLRQTAHKSAADAENMNMHVVPFCSPIVFSVAGLWHQPKKTPKDPPF